MPYTAQKSSVVFAILLIGTCLGGFGLGRQLSKQRTADQQQPPLEAPAPDVSSRAQDSGFDSPSPEQLRALIADSQYSSRRLLEIQVGVQSLDAGQLTELWAHAVTNLNLGDEEDFKIAAAILSRLAKLDPDAALACTEDAGAWKNQLQREVVGAWSTVDLPAALEWIAGAGSAVREMAMRAVLEQLGDRDRPAAIKLFREQVAKGVIGKRDWEASDFFREWAKEDPLGSAAASLEHYDFTGRNGGLVGALTSWGARKPKAALDWLNGRRSEMTPELHKELTEELVGAWSNHAPAEAAEHVLSIKDAGVFKAAAEEVMNDWAASDFEAAASWIAAAEIDPQRRKRFEAMLAMGALKHGDRVQGLDFAVSAYQTGNRGISHPLYLLASRQIGENPAAHFEWARDIAPDDRMRQEIYNTLLHQWRREDPGAAAKHVHIMTDPIRRGRSYEFFAGYWAASEPDAAREWANTLPESEERDRALIGIASKWMLQEPDAAQQWIESLDAGELRDRAASGFIGHIADEDIPTALRMATELSNPFRRDDSMEHVMRKWLEKDPAAAEAAIRENELLSGTARWRLLEGTSFGYDEDMQ